MKEHVDKLNDLLRMPHETEWLEFKEAKYSYDFSKLGKYFSALANEANLNGMKCGWLIFGVRNEDRTVCGSEFRMNPSALNNLKYEIANETYGITFIDIHEVMHAGGRVIMFEIPPAPQGLPVAFKGHWYGRDGESLCPLHISKLEKIRSQYISNDWSSETCPEATRDDLDDDALVLARKNFIEKSANQSFRDSIASWSDMTFLEKIRLIQDGKITKACLLLLGKEESVRFLGPAVAQITWKLHGEETAYEHFGPPFLLTTNKLYHKIRNFNQKIDIPNQLIPLEIPKYEKQVVLEALHNAVAHQDYNMQSRIIVTETNESLTFESAGSFFEGKLQDYILYEKTPQQYRNRLLAEAMEKLSMIDTMGYGIRKMYLEQKKRFFPLPDFDLSDHKRVVVKIYGKVIDANYTALLMEKRDLLLSSVIQLDRVQKKLNIDKKSARLLRKEKLVEGRYPNLYISASIASLVGDKAQYIKNRAFDDKHYKKMILDYIKKYGEAARSDVDALIIDKLADVLTVDQKRNKVRNILFSMSKRDKTIKNIGSGRKSIWVLHENKKDDFRR